MSEAKPSKLQLWLFRCITLIGMPILLLVGIEAGLRWLDFGDNYDFVIRLRAEGRTCAVRQSTLYLAVFSSAPCQDAPTFHHLHGSTGSTEKTFRNIRAGGFGGNGGSGTELRIQPYARGHARRTISAN